MSANQVQAPGGGGAQAGQTGQGGAPLTEQQQAEKAKIEKETADAFSWALREIAEDARRGVTAPGSQKRAKANERSARVGDRSGRSVEKAEGAKDGLGRPDPIAMAQSQVDNLAAGLKTNREKNTGNTGLGRGGLSEVL